ncbi:class I SAM-dependent methyltransferase [Cohnella yongneupensis]|uniref:Class I SAM-dependent methyltransferase n=1 Tax=Cohnella yongneupensis TaxID=425006 RepID=A0ABW0R5X4_9BACL
MFPDLSKHPERLNGQSRPWCDQLAAKTGKYEYSWHSVLEGLSAESVLTAMLQATIDGGRILDVGCAHGAYTKQWANQADEVVGFDMTKGFIATANLERPSNVQFVVGDTHDGLPFPDNTFDLAYTKKGPTSWYDEGNRVVRPGGTLIMLHPGDGNGEGGELGEVFPGLFGPAGAGTPTLDRIEERLAKSGLADIRITKLKEIVWIPTADDVLSLLTFGQSDSFAEYVRETCFKAIVSQFEKHAGEQGIRTTGFYYLVQAKASEQH